MITYTLASGDIAIYTFTEYKHILSRIFEQNKNERRIEKSHDFTISIPKIPNSKILNSSKNDWKWISKQLLFKRIKLKWKEMCRIVPNCARPVAEYFNQRTLKKLHIPVDALYITFITKYSMSVWVCGAVARIPSAHWALVICLSIVINTTVSYIVHINRLSLARSYMYKALFWNRLNSLSTPQLLSNSKICAMRLSVYLNYIFQLAHSKWWALAYTRLNRQTVTFLYSFNCPSFEQSCRCVVQYIAMMARLMQLLKTAL